MPIPFETGPTAWAVRKRTSPNSPTAKVSVEVRPVSGLANASQGRRNVFPHPFGAVTSRFAFDSLTVAGAVPELSVLSHACTGFPFHSPALRGWSKHLTTV
jgi:hypothetical protein